MTCPDCGSEVSSNRRSCPICQRLLHKEELEQLAAKAQQARNSDNIRDEISAWRSALELLPPESQQHESIAHRVAELSQALEKGGTPSLGGATDISSPDGMTASRKRWGWAGVGALGLLVWKLKAVVAFILTKGKLLLAGLTKSGTFFSMMLAFGIYWTAFGWKFALGLIVSIYIHEIGHMAALQRLGIQASAPMFIPGVGAFVRMGQYPVNAREDARVGLAGPIWGLAAAAGAFLIFFISDASIWGAIARVGAWINLFNLLPVWQLDGSRGFRALSKVQRFVVAGVMGVMWFVTGEGLLILLLIAAGIRAFATKESQSEPGDTLAFVQFVGLIILLSALCAIQVPIG